MNKLPPHFWTFEGNLYSKRSAKPFETVIRAKYEWHFARPEKAREVAACLRAGPWAWPGGYPLFFITNDGEVLCFDCVRKEWRAVVQAFLPGWGRAGWKVAACEINYENPSCFCDNCSKRIESAYAEDKAQAIERGEKEIEQP